MKICANCFKDTDLRMRILSLKNLKKCDIHNRREYIFDTDDDTVSIKVDMGRLVNLYDTTSSIDNSSLTGKTLIDRIQNDWQIFSTNINENQIRTVLVELLKDSFDKDDPIYKSPLVIPDLYNNQFTVQELMDGLDSRNAVSIIQENIQQLSGTTEAEQKANLKAVTK